MGLRSLVVLVVLLATGLSGFLSSATAQTRGGGTNCPTTGPCLSSDGPRYSKIGARLRLARDLVREVSRDSILFGRGGAPDDLTRDHGGATLRFRRILEDEQLRELRELGIRFVRDADGTFSRVGSIYLAEVPWSALDALASLPYLVRAESTWAPQIERPLEVTSQKVGASKLRRHPDYGLDGEGVLLGDIDSGFDIYHPHLFRADGGWYRWIDVENDGRFDPGTDGVDLNADGSIDSGEVLKVLDGTVWTNRGRVNNDGELQPAKDWLYVDVNGDGKRNVGPNAGFSESDPGYGEPVFVADDLDADGRLETTEKLVQLDSSKFTRVFANEKEYERGQNLAELGKPDPEDRAYHGTGVASVLVGGQPQFHDRVGLAPKAELVGYSHTAGASRSQGQFALQHQFIQHAKEHDVDALVHEWTDFFSTPQDGSTNVESAMDTARNQGTIQVNPLGNLNLSKKHVSRPVQAGDEPSLSFVVDEGFQRGGQTYSYNVVWGALLWRADQNPTVTLQSPGGGEVEFDPGQRTQSIGDHTLTVETQTSPRMTHHLLFVLWDRQSGLDRGTWTLQLSDVTEQDRVVGRISDRYSSWSVGVRWKNPTRDRGTMVYPSTADAAVGVAAFGGRHDMPRDGGGSEVGELRNYSGRGPRIDGARGVDIAAPDDPYAAFGVSDRYTQRGVGRSWFRRFGGTSGAGPHVAAAFALLKQAHPSWGPDRLESRLFETAAGETLVPDAGPTPNRSWGHGKVDLFEAVAGAARPDSGMAPSADLAVQTGPDEVRYDATGSTDADSSDLEYRFDFDYDGEWDRDWKTRARASAPRSFFDGPNTYLARVEVRDERGVRTGTGVRFDLEADGGDPAPDVGGDDVAEPSPGDTGTTSPDDAAGAADPAPAPPAIVANNSNAADGCVGCNASGRPAAGGWLLTLFAVVFLRRRHR